MPKFYVYGCAGESKIFPAIDPDVVSTVQELLVHLRNERESVEEQLGRLSQELVSSGFILLLHLACSPYPRIRFG